MKKREPKVIETGLIEWLTAKEHLRKLFTEDEIVDALAQTEYTSNSYKISSTEWYEQEPQWCTPRERVGSIPRVEEKNKMVNGREERIKITKHEWRIPSNYQGDVVSQIIRIVLGKKYEWFKEMDWAVYGNMSNDAEIYLNTEYDHEKWEGQQLTLYVPLTALIEGNWKAIEARNVNYWKEYCNPERKGTWNNRPDNPTYKEVYEGYIEVLNTPEVLKLKKILTNDTKTDKR